MYASRFDSPSFSISGLLNFTKCCSGYSSPSSTVTFPRYSPPNSTITSSRLFLETEFPTERVPSFKRDNRHYAKQ